MLKKLLLLLAVAVIFAALDPSIAFAEGGDVVPGAKGQELYCAVSSVITGPIGTTVGLIVAFSGLFMFVLHGGNSNLVTIFVGVAITAYPSIHENFLRGMSGAISGSATHKYGHRFEPESCAASATQKERDIKDLNEEYGFDGDAGDPFADPE